MKKFLAIVIAMLMVLSLFGCSGTTTTTASTAPSTEATPSAAATSVEPTKVADASGQKNTGNTGNQPLDKVGFYDPNYDYTKNKKYKIQYMVAATGPLYEMFSKSFAHWASKMNMDYGEMWASGGDNDVYINQISTFINQGVNGFLMDPDPNLYKRINEICNEAGVPYIGCMSPARDMEATGTPMIGPFVGFDYYWFGQQMGTELIKYAKTNWPDVPMDQIGFISVDYTLYPALHDRSTGAVDVWNKETGLKDNVFIADTTTVGPTLDGTNTVVTAVLSTETKYTHWLCATLYDDMAQGAAAAFDAMGLTDVACVTTVGGAALQRQWDAGQNDAWKFSLYTPQSIYAEPIVGALYAFMNKDATPQTIWPSWVNPKDHGAGTDKYASLLLPSYVMTHDNYKQFLKWSDIYTGSNEFPDYSSDGITRDTYNARLDIPDSYKS